MQLQSLEVGSTGKIGRQVLKTFAFAFVLAGPVANILQNGHEVIRVFACTSSLAYNLTRTKYQLMVQPFQEALFGMKHDVEQIEDTLQGLSDVVDPIVAEVEDESEIDKLKTDNDYVDMIQGDTLRSKELENKYKELSERKKRKREANQSYDGKIYEETYKRKVEYRCQGLVSEGTTRCRRLFQNAYEGCANKVTYAISWLLCWPMKLTFVCNLVESFGGSSICDPSHVVPPGFGDGYVSLKNTKSTLQDNFRDVKLQYVVHGIPQKIDFAGADALRQSILQEFEDKQTLFDSLLLIMRRLFVLMFLIVIYKASQYHEKYLSNIEFDNKYVTKYFKKIDRRRKIQNKLHLLPLKRVENNSFKSATKLLPTKGEIGSMLKATLLLFIHMIPAMTILLLDFILFEALDIIRKHAHVEFTQEGEHNMMLKIHGSGLVANIVRSLVQGFNIKKRIHVVHSNAACLPQPLTLPQKKIFIIFGLYFLVWLLIVFEPYTLRLNRLICAACYPKREKQRILFLYNETLKKRVGYFKNLKRDIQLRAMQFRRNKQYNPLLRARLKGRSALKILPAARFECLICGYPEDLFGNNLIQCPTENCHAHYCSECWQDIEMICYNCNTYGNESFNTESSDHDLNHDDDDDDDEEQEDSF